MAGMKDVRVALEQHVERLLRCRSCPKMGKPVVSGPPVVSEVILVGQAPGPNEPKLGRPFAWTAGKTLFRWFNEATGLDEQTVRERIYFAAVCRCFPGKNPLGGDRVPDEKEIEACSRWMEAEFRLLKPKLVLAVGKLAIGRFLEFEKLNEVVGRTIRCEAHGVEFDLLPLPHPSGASTWHRTEPGRTLLRRALKILAQHPAFPSGAVKKRVSRSGRGGAGAGGGKRGSRARR